MPKALTIKKVKDGLHVTLGTDVPTLTQLKVGAKVQPEFLHALLSYHIAHQDSKGTLPAKHAKRIKPMW